MKRKTYERLCVRIKRLEGRWLEAVLRVTLQDGSRRSSIDLGSFQWVFSRIANYGAAPVLGPGSRIRPLVRVSRE